MTRKTSMKQRLAAFLAVGCLATVSGGCVADNFWATQLDNTLTSVVGSVVGSTVIAAVDTALGS